MKRRVKILGIIIIAIFLITACKKQPGSPAGNDLSDNMDNEIDLTTGFLKGTADEYRKITENDSLVLSANVKTGEISILDKESKKEWYSNPRDKEKDALANGYNKISLFSQVLLTYTTNTGVVMNVGSFMGSISRSGLTYRIEDDGIIFIYDFVKEELVVPVRYSLKDGDFVAEILTAGIKELGTNKITTIDLLPFFGAGSYDDEGYILVPDGSGALLYFNNGKENAREFEKNLYGFDNGTNDRLLGSPAAVGTSFTISENAYLPVFGEKCNEDGFIAIMTDGAARASVKARTAGKYTSYNHAWSTYNYRSVGTVRLMQKEMNQATVSIPEKNPDTSVNYKVLYRFLKTGSADYSNMAEVYRSYLIDNEGLTARTKEGDIPFYLDLYGYVRKTKSFIGIPKDTLIVTTSISDSSAIVDELYEAGVKNIVLKYNYWMKDGYYDKIQTSAKTERKLGSGKDMLDLAKKLNMSGGSLYPAAELMNVYKTGKGVSKYNDILNSVAETPQLQYQFSRDSALADPRYEPWYLMKPSHLPEYYFMFTKNLTDSGLSNAAFDSIGTMAYSELCSGGTSRTVIPELLSGILKDADEKLDNIMLSGANSFAAVHAAHILNSPEKSSRYDIEDADIPFYQMVFHGYADYSLGATNLSSNPEDMALKCLEYGASPMYSWVAKNSEELVGSRTDHIFSPDYRKWIDFAVSEYEKINAVLYDTATQPITSHRIIQEGVTETVYGGSLKVIVNYNNSEVSVDGRIVSKKGYLVLTGAQD